MPDPVELQEAAPVGTVLESLGWPADDTLVRALGSTAGRGHHVAALVPPEGRYLAPACAPALAALPEGARVLVLVADALLDDVASTMRRLAAPLGRTVLAGRSLGRLAARLPGPSDVLVTTPTVAAALQARSLLPAQAVALTVLAWPDTWDDREVIPDLLQDLPKDGQRILTSADPAILEPLVERHLRKAVVSGLPPVEGPAPGQLGPVRVVVVPAAGRAGALEGILDVLDPPRLAVWTPDPAEQALLRARLAALPLPFEIGAAPGEAECVVAWSLPRREELEALLALKGEVVMLVPPGATRWLGRLAAPIRPLRLPDALDGLESRLAAERRSVAERLSAGEPALGLQAIGPLLERWSATEVAAALYELWQARRPGSGTAPAERATAQAAGSGAAARIWVGVGKNDGATPADFVAILTKELGVDRTQVGRIELRDSFSLIEVPGAQVEQLARGLDGRTIRQRRVSARPDRGSPARPERPGARPGPGGRGRPRPGGRGT